jgi:hypothetical protein
MNPYRSLLCFAVMYASITAHDGEQPPDQNGSQRSVYELDDHEDHYLAVVDLTQPGDDEAEDGGQYGSMSSPGCRLRLRWGVRPKSLPVSALD